LEIARETSEREAITSRIELETSRSTHNVCTMMAAVISLQDSSYLAEASRKRPLQQEDTDLVDIKRERPDNMESMSLNFLIYDFS